MKSEIGNINHLLVSQNLYAISTAITTLVSAVTHFSIEYSPEVS